ncbi:NUDIX domain-containing protein [Candidatus Woesearchaeota archaeon]|nr:NUDIX domain-containing protein [Candidatus Woesearchaeota archaeon]
MPKVISAGAVIFRIKDGKPEFLLLHYAAGHWEFVKGHVEKGEEDISTVKREAEEEAGIKDLRILDGFVDKITYFYKSKGETVSKEVNFYLGETKTKEVKLSFEHQGFEWLGYEESMEKLTFKNAKETLRKAQVFLAKQNF